MKPIVMNGEKVKCPQCGSYIVNVLCCGFCGENYSPQEIVKIAKKQKGDKK